MGLICHVYLFQGIYSVKQHFINAFTTDFKSIQISTQMSIQIWISGQFVHIYWASLWMSLSVKECPISGEIQIPVIFVPDGIYTMWQMCKWGNSPRISKPCCQQRKWTSPFCMRQKIEINPSCAISYIYIYIHIYIYGKYKYYIPQESRRCNYLYPCPRYLHQSPLI